MFVIYCKRIIHLTLYARCRALKRAENGLKGEDMTYYLAIDIGASSGRHMIAWLDDGKIRMEEIYRFPNGLVRKEDGTMCWDIPTLFGHVVEGIKKAAEMGKRPSYLGIDTWGVDFVLLDKMLLFCYLILGIKVYR